MKHKIDNNDYEQIVDLFRKVIASLVCIEKITQDLEIMQASGKYLKDLIVQYENYLTNKDLNKLEFKYSEKEIVDFSNECYDKVDIFTFAEDVEFGFSELVKKILKGREYKKNG